MQQVVRALTALFLIRVWLVEHGVAVEAGRQQMIGRHLVSLVADLLRVPLVHHGRLKCEAISLTCIDYLAWLWYRLS